MLTSASIPFAVAAAGWHEFYLLAGGAAATLSGLMFLAVTFGSTLSRSPSGASPRAFIDPPFSHFVQVLLTSLAFVMPSMTAPVLGGLLLAGGLLRAAGLIWVYRHFRLAHRVHGDIELSDWLISIALPGATFLLVLIAGAGLLIGRPEALAELGWSTVALLAIGIRAAWEILVWLAEKMPNDEPAKRNSSGAASS